MQVTISSSQSPSNHQHNHFLVMPTDFIKINEQSHGYLILQIHALQEMQ